MSILNNVERNYIAVKYKKQRMKVQMDILRILLLLMILIGILMISLFIGSGTKEGIIVSDYYLLKAILNDADNLNASCYIKTISRMNIQDLEFKKIMESDDKDAVKIEKLKTWIRILSLEVPEGKKLSEVLNKEISVDRLLELK